MSICEKMPTNDWSVLSLATGEIVHLCGVALDGMSRAEADAVAYLLEWIPLLGDRSAGARCA